MSQLIFRLHKYLFTYYYSKILHIYFAMYNFNYQNYDNCNTIYKLIPPNN